MKECIRSNLSKNQRLLGLSLHVPESVWAAYLVPYSLTRRVCAWNVLVAFVDSVNLLTGPLTNGQNILERDEREEMWVFIPLLPRSWDTEGGCLSELKVSMSVGWPHTPAYSLTLSVPPWSRGSPFSARFHPAAPEGHWTHG